jgi:hypothetical protein
LPIKLVENSQNATVFPPPPTDQQGFDMTEAIYDRIDHVALSARRDPLQMVREMLADLRFGAIQLTVHEGRIVQLEVTEKHRF